MMESAGPMLIKKKVILKMRLGRCLSKKVSGNFDYEG